MRLSDIEGVTGIVGFEARPLISLTQPIEVSPCLSIAQLDPTLTLREEERTRAPISRAMARTNEAREGKEDGTIAATERGDG